MASLSSVELLALILGTGGNSDMALDMAHALLKRFSGLRELSRVLPMELSRVPGIAQGRSALLAAAFELGRRAVESPVTPLETVESPEEAAEILSPVLSDLAQESVAVLSLGGRHQLLHLEIVALGALNSAAVAPREVFRGAIRVGAAALLLAHNHPSGCPQPSEEDIRLTRRLARCGETLGIVLLDHLVLGAGSYVSLKERGII